MFPAAYFPPRYFAPRYWPKIGAAPSPTNETGCFFYLIDVTDDFPDTAFYQSMVMLPARYNLAGVTMLMMAAETTESQHSAILNHWPQPDGWTGTVEEARTIMREHDATHLWWLFDHFLSIHGFRDGEGEFR